MKTARNYGVDLFRIFAAFLVVGVHVFGVCVDMQPTNGSDLTYFTSSFFYSLFFCAVNCFGLISGYVCYRDNAPLVRISSLQGFWIEAVFYRILCLVLLHFSGISYAVLSQFIFCFFPITKGNNWYLIAYFETMLIMAPAINYAVEHSSRKANFEMMAWVFFLTSVINLAKGVLDFNLFALNDGYSSIWLSILYFYGASIRKQRWFQNISARKGFLFCLLMMFAMASWRTFIPRVFQLLIQMPKGREFWYDYTSPVIVAMSIALLISFEKLSVPHRIVPVIRKVSATTFGIFIFHVTIFGPIIRPAINPILSLPYILQPFVAMLVTLIIVIICTFVDLIRTRLFYFLKIGRVIDDFNQRVWNLYINIENRCISWIT